MKIQLVVLLVCVLISFTNASNGNVSFKTDRNLEIYNGYVHMDKQIKQLVETGVKKVLPYILEASEYVNISSTCRDNLFQLMTGFRRLTDWSISFLDATGKPQSGILSGNIEMFGESAQCFDTVVMKKDKIDFRGQYCSVIFKPLLPDDQSHFPELDDLPENASGFMKFILSKLYLFYNYDPKIGMCVPSGCTKQDISQILRYISKDIHINATVSYCIKKEDGSFWSNSKTVVVCIFVFLGILLIISTILDNTLWKWKNNNLGLAPRLLQCFSITRNFPKLINTNGSGDVITCFCGIRVLSAFWIILCHEYAMILYTQVGNHVLNVQPFIQGFLQQMVMNGFPAIYIFFFLGGFVNCYTRVKLHKSGKSQPNLWTIIVHRLWRTYPTLIVGFLIFILLNTASAPFYQFQSAISEVCRKYWWRNFLFINNFYNPSDVCLPHTWYLCADMQLFLLSLITVPVLLRKEKLGIYLHIGILFIANIGCFCLWWIENLPPTPAIMNFEDIRKFNINYFQYQMRIYFLPLGHLSSYFIGILLGYVVASKKEKKFSKVLTVFGWLVASFLYIFMIFVTYRWNSGIEYTKLESSSYGSLSKPIVVSAVAWMVYCCKTGQAKLVNYILSLKIWMPLSRLTFMLYMVTFTVQFYFYNNVNFPPDFATIRLIWSYFGNLSVSLLMSLALVLVVESPFLALEKILFRRDRSEKESPLEFQKEITFNNIKENGLKENGEIQTIHL